MQASQYNNQKLDPYLDIYSVVTNGEGWQLYKLTLDKLVYGSELYPIGNLPPVLGISHFVFHKR